MSRPTAGMELRTGEYALRVGVFGTGRSSLGALALTRSLDDTTLDADGTFLYVRDVVHGGVWSATLQPTPARPERYEARRAPTSLALRRVDGGIEVTTEICLTSDGSGELRRYTISNAGPDERRLELTTYAEVVLNTPAGDAGHPAFSKLFVQTEWDEAREALIARRRQRSPDDETLWFGHAFVAHGPGRSTVDGFETDRMRFIGRGRTTASPRAVDAGVALTRTVGNVLDPVVSLRRTVTIAAGASVQVTALYCAAPTRAEVDAALERHGRPAAIHETFATLPPPDDPAFEPVSLPPRAGETGDLFRTPRGSDAGGDGRDARWASEELRHDNGYGGFTPDGTEYVIRMPIVDGTPRRPPLPWVNVIANERTGFLVSESGAANSWSANSREHRLTPWLNDPVSDPHGEALWLRDEERGVFWSPTPGPTPAPAAYEVRHGFGYTRFLHTSFGLEQEVLQFVPLDDAVKVTRLRVTNTGATERRLTAWSYAHLVLGVLPSETRGHVATMRDPVDGAIYAVTPGDGEFAGRVAFAAAAGNTLAVHATADREAFLGLAGTVAAPLALRTMSELESRVGEGLDPCAALQAAVLVPPGGTVDIVFLLGEGDGAAAARALVRQYGDPAAVERAFAHVCERWHKLLGAVRVETPSSAIDLMVNGWLPYQNLSCRILGRTAFYQSGGAYGFRDQLQDSAALLMHDPAITRRQIVLHAAHQFVQGDVMHWWHPPTSKGIRTRFSDDLVWLPYVTAHYLQTTGDWTVLDELAPFLTARPLEDGEDEAFVFPERSGHSADVFEHCARVLDRSLTRGAHGLPLMGTGDWNDGMNRVGRLGTGESVWLGFFLATTLDAFIPIAERRGDHGRAERWHEYREALGAALNAGGWDGEWYRRAYYDDGTPLGSAANDECRIDAIAQAWSVISRVAPAVRAEQALDAMERELVDEDAGIIRLLTPAFDRTPHDPGYIKGYLPGVRENGGQYTHGALWAVRALAEAGRTERAASLLEMLTPIDRSATRAGAERYMVEPYVIAADVYGVAPHIGRGGWTWYTGSAGWMGRVAVESVLGLRFVDGEALEVRPCIPAAWPGFQATLRTPSGGTITVVVRRTTGHTTVECDGAPVALEDGRIVIPIGVAGETHRAEVSLGPDQAPRYGD